MKRVRESIVDLCCCYCEGDRGRWFVARACTTSIVVLWNGSPCEKLRRGTGYICFQTINQSINQSINRSFRLRLRLRLLPRKHGSLGSNRSVFPFGAGQRTTTTTAAVAVAAVFVRFGCCCWKLPPLGWWFWWLEDRRRASFFGC
jgi:hypothetical protein